MALVVAAANGQGAILEHLLEAGASMDADGAVGTQPALAHAVRGGHLSIVVRLMKAGADPHWRDADGRSFVHTAAAIGNLELVKALASQIGVGAFELKDDIGSTALHAAARANQVEVVRFLLSNGADALRKNVFGFDLMGIATEAGAVDVVNDLLNQQVPYARDGAGGLTPVEAAAGRGKAALFRRLHTSMPANALACGGPPLLVSAAHALDIEMIDYLVSSGFQVDERDGLSMTALMHACWTGDADMVEALLQHGADPEAVGPDGTSSSISPGSSYPSRNERGRTGSNQRRLV